MKYRNRVTMWAGGRCLICNDSIDQYSIANYIWTDADSHDLFMCNKCVSIPSEAILDSNICNELLRNAINIYNNTFSDSISIEDYLKLTLGRAS